MVDAIDGAPVRTAALLQQSTDTFAQDSQKAFELALADATARIPHGGRHGIPMFSPGPDGPDDGGQKGSVKKNSQGQVIEVDFPNGKHRLFGYDKNGNLDRVVQPDGTIIQLVNGTWEYPQSETGADFLNPQVASDGTLSYQTREGAYVNDFNDGTQTTINKDLSIVKQDADGNVVEIDYANGSQKQFSHSPNGDITKIVENGKTYTVDHNGNIKGPDGSIIGTHPYVSSNGTYYYIDQNNNNVAINTDQSQSIRVWEGLIIKNTAGRITEIDYPGRTSRKFGYDGYGQLNSITDANGKTYTYAPPLGEWVDASGNPAPFSNPNLSADGTYSYIDASSKVVSDYANGASATTTQTAEQISHAAVDIHNDIVLTASGHGRSAQINALLSKMSPADAAQLEEQYQNTYGVSLYSDLGRSQDTAGQQILTGDGVRTAALKSRPVTGLIHQNGSDTFTVGSGPYKGWTVSTFHKGPGQDVVSLINPNNQLVEVDRPDGSRVVLTYADPHDTAWFTLTDSQTGRTYLRTGLGIQEVGANGQVIGRHNGVWVNPDGTITLDNPTQVWQLVKFDAGVSPAVQWQVIQELNNLPPNIKQMLLEDRTSIEITPDPVYAQVFGKPVGGYMNSSINKIVIHADPNLVKENLAHEIAHAVDDYNLHITSSPGFQAAIDQDLKNGLPKDQGSYSYELVDDPQNPTYKFGEGDLYAEIVAGLLGYDQSGMPSKMMKDYPTLTAYIKRQLGMA